MKKLGAILFGIVLILGLSIEATSAQQVEVVNPDGVVSSGDWWPTPTAGILSDWGPDADLSYVAANEWDDSMTVDFEDPTGGPYTAINVKIRANSDDFGSVLSFGKLCHNSPNPSFRTSAASRGEIRNPVRG